MVIEHRDLSERERLLDEVATAFLKALETGQAPDRQAWLERYPEIAGELREFFADQERLDGWATPLRSAFPLETPPPTKALEATGGEEAPAGPRSGEPLSSFGDYELIEEIGHGGMSVVFKARQRSLNRLVALKMIRGGKLASAADVARFHQEAATVAILDHPHIVPIHEVGAWRPDGVGPPVPYFSMKLIEGGSLAQAVGNGQWAVDSDKMARLAAQVMAMVARAVHYAHQHAILHRDLKPSNILLDAEGRPHVADFGLAKRLARSGTPSGEADLTQSGDLIGTPRYMAPEQATGAKGAVTTATDVYGLGAILYALVTGRPPVEAATVLEAVERVRNSEPVPPRKHNPRLNRDLETICLKALAKNPEQRYAGAAAMADDLERYLAGEPIEARPAGSVEKAWRWCRRNRRGVGLAAVVGVLLVGVVATALVAATTEAREQKHRALLERLQVIRFSPHEIGWSHKALSLAEEAARIRRTHLAQSLAAATLRGLDAVPIKHFPNESASALVFDRRGEKLLLGGIHQHKDTPAAAARVWNLSTAEIEVVSEKGGPGPVGFLNDSPVHLFAREGPELVLWDILKQKELQTFRLDLPPERAKGWRWVNDDPKHSPDGPLVVMTPDGMRVAAAAVGPEGEAMVTAWNGITGKPLATFKRKMQALAFTRDGQYLAGGDGDGRIMVWPLAGKGEPVTIEATRLEILCLAFSPDGKLLAAGDSGANVTTWEWRTQRRQMRYVGSSFHVFRVAYSPDGTLLAAGGRNFARLWDAATGALLLESNTDHLADYLCALTFSSDGRHLATANYQAWHPANVRVYELQNGRGVRTLRGLSSPVQSAVFSPDGTLIGAFTHNWQAGVWETGTGRLLRVLDIPRGEFSDNCALAFSPDNRRVAVASFTEAKMWDLDTGKEQSWKLPMGFCNALIFHRDGSLLLLRAETVDGKERPYGNDFKLHPRVCRLRNLLEPDEDKGELAVIKEFNRSLHGVWAAPDGNTFLVTGSHDKEDGKRRTLRAYDARTGKEKWFKGPWSDLDRTCQHTFEPSGTFVAFQPVSSKSGADLLDLATGTPLDHFPNLVTMSPGAKQIFINGPLDTFGEARGFSLVARGRKEPLFVWGAEGGSDALSPGVFSLDGDRTAQGHQDGTVTIMHLPEVQRNLTAIGLGW